MMNILKRLKMTLLIKQIHNIHFNQIEGIIYMKIVTPAKIIVKFILLITLLTVIVVIAAFIKRDKNRKEYSIAIEHLNNKEYENAIYSFNKLNGYKDLYPELHYFEISIMLYYAIRNTFVMLCHKYNEKNAINGVDIIAITDRDIVELLEQYEKRSTEKFELQQSRLQK